MGAHKFWLGWLRVFTYISIAFGLLSAFFGHVNLLQFLSFKIDEVFLASLENVEGAKDLESWLMASMGGIVVCWGILLLFLINNPLKRGEYWAWKAIFLSVMVWFAFDTGFSLYYGAKFNALFNVFALSQVVGPLLFLRSSCKKLKVSE